MPKVGSIVMYSWGLISGLVSLVYSVRSNTPDDSCLTAMGLVITTFACGFGFILQAMTQSDPLPAAGRNQGRQPKDGPDLIMQSAQSPKFFDD